MYLSLEVDEAVALGGVGDGVLDDLARQDVAEGREGVEQGLFDGGRTDMAV